MSEKSERTGAVQPGKGKAQGHLISVMKSLEMKKRGTDFSVVPLTQWPVIKTHGILSYHKKTLFICVDQMMEQVIERGRGIPLNISKDWTQVR